MSNQKELKEIIIKITDKLVAILHNVREYENIFDDKSETIAIIKESSPDFFQDLYWLYWNFITINICALWDSPKSLGNSNLSIPHVLKLVIDEKMQCKDKVIELRDEVEIIIKPFKKARNKSFSHFDLGTICSEKKLEAIQLGDLVSICYLTGDIINEINKEFGQESATFEFMRSLHGSKKLMYILKLGIDKKNQFISETYKNKHSL